MESQNLRRLVTPVTLIALCGILAFGAWWGYKQVTAPLFPPTPCVETSTAELATTQVVARVLNGGFTTGLGTKVKTSMEGLGFTVSSTGNTEERIKKTIIVAHTADSPEAQLVAGFFPESTVRADPNRVDGQVDVLIGSEYIDINTQAPKSVAVPSGMACLAVKPSTTPAPSPAK